MHDPSEQAEKQPLIIAFIADVFFVVKVEQAAQALGFRVEWIERVSQVSDAEPLPPGRYYAEHLVGPGRALIDLLTLRLPALLIFDMNNAEIPWREWIALIKSAPATRRIPLLAFGSHVDTASLRDAREAGADAVLARSQFSASLPELIRKYARTPDTSAWLATCQEPLSPLAVRGLEEFNRGEYFEAHETLEEAWNEDTGLGRDLYRAILQVAVAYLQIERRNFPGAIKMFLRMRQWFAPLPDECRGVDIARLRHDTQRIYEQLTAAGADGIQTIDPGSFAPVRYRSVSQDQG
jgi:predicted metal-dependent hydrolase